MKKEKYTLFVLLVLFIGFQQSIAQHYSLYWPFTESSYDDRGGNCITDVNQWQATCLFGEALHGQGDYYAQDWERCGGVSSCGSDFLAPMSGTVIYSGTSAETFLGNQVIILSEDSSLAFRIAHLDSISENITKGTCVQVGCVIGITGSSGTTNCHAHMVLYKDLSTSIFGSPALEHLENGLGLGFGDGSVSCVDCSDISGCYDDVNTHAADFRFSAGPASEGPGTCGCATNINTTVTTQQPICDAAFTGGIMEFSISMTDNSLSLAGEQSSIIYWMTNNPEVSYVYNFTFQQGNTTIDELSIPLQGDGDPRSLVVEVHVGGQIVDRQEIAVSADNPCLRASIQNTSCTYCQGNAPDTWTLVASVPPDLLTQNAQYLWYRNGGTAPYYTSSNPEIQVPAEEADYEVFVVNGVVAAATSTLSRATVNLEDIIAFIADRLHVEERDCDNCTDCDDWEIPVVRPRDPNDILGPEGYGPEHWVSVNDRLGYTIRFENDPKEATAPAQRVEIRHPLSDKLNLYSLRLGAFGFGSFVFQVPANTTSYTQRLDVKDSLGLYVDVTAGIDISRGEAFWIFQSIDPATGLVPTDALAGFLPVNDTVFHRGEGFVSFDVVPDPGAQTGDTAHAWADIIFDTEEALRTPPIYNLIDALPPSSAVDTVLSGINDTLQLHWSGTDDTGGSGLASYSLYVSENQQNFAQYQSSIADTIFTFPAESGKAYRFYTRAADYTGNTEQAKMVAEQSYVTGSLQLTAAPGGTSHCPGDSLLIDWESSGVAAVNIGVSYDNGASYTPLLVNRDTAQRPYYWVLPGGFSSTGSYQVVLSDAGESGLTDTGAVFGIYPRPLVSLGADTTLCAGQSFLLDAGTGFSSYLWSDGSTAQTLSVTQSGTYEVKVTDSNGCSTSSSIAVLVHPLPTLYLGADTTLCEALTFPLDAGAGFSSYQWSTGDTTQQLTVSSSGTYSVVVTDSSGCDNTDSITVVIAPVTPLSLGADTSLCAGESLQLDAGAGYASYLWSDGSTGQTITLSSAGIYTVTVSNAGGCTSTDSIAVAVNPLPSVSISGTPAFCPGEPVSLSVNSSGSVCSWMVSDGNSTVTYNGTSIAFVAADVAHYSIQLTCTDNTGACSNSSTLTLYNTADALNPTSYICGDYNADTTFLAREQIYTGDSCSAPDYTHIQAGARVVMQAGSRVFLRPGFRAYPHSYYKAVIADACDTNATPGSTAKGKEPANETEKGSTAFTVWPNPFNQSLNIGYQLNRGMHTEVYLHDLLGKELARLTERHYQEAGRYEFRYDASQLEPGVYFIALKRDGEVLSRKLVKVE